MPGPRGDDRPHSSSVVERAQSETTGFDSNSAAFVLRTLDTIPSLSGPQISLSLQGGELYSCQMKKIKMC